MAHNAQAKPAQTTTAATSTKKTLRISCRRLWRGVFGKSNLLTDSRIPFCISSPKPAIQGKTISPTIPSAGTPALRLMAPPQRREAQSWVGHRAALISDSEQIIIQIKGGKTGVKDVRDLRCVLDREQAAMGVLISLQPPTGPMEAEAASAGFYTHKMNQQQYPRLQLRTVK